MRAGHRLLDEDEDDPAQDFNSFEENDIFRHNFRDSNVFDRPRGPAHRQAREQVNVMPGWIVFIPILLVYGSCILTWIMKRIVGQPTSRDENVEPLEEDEGPDGPKQKTE